MIAFVSSANWLRSRFRNVRLANCLAWLSLVAVMGIANGLQAQTHQLSFKLPSPDSAARVSIISLAARGSEQSSASTGQPTTLPPTQATLSPAGAIVRKTSKGMEYFYMDGKCQVAATNQPYMIVVSQGIETRPDVRFSQGTADVAFDIQLDRWIDLPSLGWYSGDSHVHLHTGGPIKVSIVEALQAARAEDLHYVNLCVSNNLGDDLRDAELVTGRPEASSDARHLLVFGEEMRSSIYGHMQFFGIKKIVLPQYTGFDNTPNQLDFPCNYTLAKEACDQGGVVTYGHPMLKNTPDAFGNKLTEPHGAARELPIDAALGVVQAIDLMSYNCDKDLSTELWYRLLNCGLHLSACVGTDALLDQSTDPMGGARVYAHTGGQLTMESWLEALRAGRTFVTNGPMLFFKVNDRMPGQTIKVQAATKVSVSLELQSLMPVTRLELIVNGQVAKSIDVPAPGAPQAIQGLRLQHDLELEQSSWIALRAKGLDHKWLFDGPAWAHTSPVWVEVAGQGVRIEEDRRFMAEWIEKLLRVVQTRNRYPTSTEREQVENLYRKAKEYYTTTTRN